MLLVWYNLVNFGGEQVQKEKAQSETHKEVALEERRWREQVAAKPQERRGEREEREEREGGEIDTEREKRRKEQGAGRGEGGTHLKHATQNPLLLLHCALSFMLITVKSRDEEVVH